MTVDSVDVADCNSRKIYFWFVSDVSGGGDWVVEVLLHGLEYPLEGEGPEANEDDPPHGCSGPTLSLGRITDSQDRGVVSKL